MTEIEQWLELSTRFKEYVYDRVTELRSDAKVAGRGDIMKFLTPWAVGKFLQDVRRARESGLPLATLDSASRLCEEVTQRPEVIFTDEVAARFGVALLSGDLEFVDSFTKAIKTSVLGDAAKGVRTEQYMNVVRNFVGELDRLGVVDLTQPQSREACRAILRQVTSQEPKLEKILRKKYFVSKVEFKKVCDTWFRPAYFVGLKMVTLQGRDGRTTQIRVPEDFVEVGRRDNILELLGDFSFFRSKKLGFRKK